MSVGRISAAWDCGGLGLAVESGLAFAGVCFSVGIADPVGGTLSVGIAFSRLTVAVLAGAAGCFPTCGIDWQEFKARARLKRMAKRRNRIIILFSLSCAPPLYWVVKERISATVSFNYNLVDLKTVTSCLSPTKRAGR